MMLYDAQNQMIGERCLCLDGGVAGTTARAEQTLELTPGTPYTLSFYAKVCGCMALRVAIAYRDAQGERQILESPILENGPLYKAERLFHTFTLPQGSAREVTLSVEGQGEAGSVSRAWVDCAQLEEGVLANRYNLLINGDFSYHAEGHPLNWYTGEENTTREAIVLPTDLAGKPAGMSGQVLRLTGEAEARRADGWHQTIPLSGRAGDVFLLGGWARGFAASDVESEKRFGIHLSFRNEVGEYTEGEPVSWVTQRDGWQFVCGAGIAKENYEAVRFHIEYTLNINTAEFDGLFLHREQFGRSYDYDASGNAISA